jgi:Cu+-exporting ATPase
MPVVTDPVCGMQVNEEDAPARSEYRGESFYFCSDTCRNTFDREPDRYAGVSAAGRDDATSAGS